MSDKIIHAVEMSQDLDSSFGDIVTDGFFATHVAKQMKKNAYSVL